MSSHAVQCELSSRALGKPPRGRGPYRPGSADGDSSTDGYHPIGYPVSLS